MGNLCTCFSRKPVKKRRLAAAKRLTNHGHPPPSLPGSTAARWNRSRSSRGDKVEALSQEEAAAAAAAILLRRRQQNGQAERSAAFDRSASHRYPSSGPKKQAALPRSSSSRARSLTDPLLQPQQLVNQEIKIDDLETGHFVLVHGGGFGAWCWYKTIAYLEEGGFKVTAIDLTGSGIHSSDTNGVTSLSQYVKPLTDFLEKLADGEKVILVGHDFGGACISYAMELLPSKISKAIFVAAAMLTNGQSTLDMFAKQVVRGVRSRGLENREVLVLAGTNDLMQQTQIFLYANGNDSPPTAIDLDRSLLKDLLFNRSPSKDVALASVSMRPIPFAPVLEKLSLSKKYGIVRRFYIETSEDNAISLELQESMVNADPPERVFLLRGSDHSPFFSKPQGLHKILVEISRTP